MTFRALLSIALALSLSACAGQARLASAEPPQPEPTWAFEASDVPVDPAFRFGQLDNGMRYIVRQNATPAGTALVRMEIAAGSLDETDSELGYAHFVEHMAFNGSTNVPEGEMVRLLERNGLAFGADTNASTSFSQTTYKLDLPRNDPALLDVALMLMRETASELTISDEAVERERGVLLSEMRDRNTYALREALDSAEFMYPDARYPKRFPIGAAETLNAANGTNLRAFWEREYVPEQTTVVVVGDFDRELVEAAIRARFADWQARPPEPQPDAGPVDPRDKGRTDIYIDPALPERVEMVRNGAWLDDADTILQRQENLLRQIGYGIVNRRFLRIARAEDPPFRGAGFGTADVFEAGRVTRLIVDTSDRKWRTGMLAAVAEYRRAMANGFTDGEVAEQVANTRTQIEDAAASADTRSHGALVNAAFALVRDDQVPSTPASVLERFNAFVGKIEPAAVLAALKREAVELVDPLIRFRGRFAPEGREKALRAAWKEAVRQPIPDEANSETAAFAYTDFGTPGTVVSDTTGALGIRTLRFANGVTLNLKPTDLEQDRIRLSLAIDGGEMLDTRENPLATEMMSYFAAGGLGQHSQDDLDTVLAGKSVYAGLRADVDTFSAQALTTPRDLETQLQLLAAYVTDPAYRREAEVQYRHAFNRYFAQLRATPSSALRAEISGILSDGDPRFTLQDPAEYRALTMAGLRDAISERLANGAIEIGIVGDFNPDEAIALVAKTFGALPARESEFGTYPDQPPRSFTADRSERIVRHEGAADQALLHLTWPTRDDSDPVETLALELTERVVRIALTDTLREKLGQAYSPGAASSPSRHWQDYGSFGIAASVDVGQVDPAREAINGLLASLRETGPDADTLDRARQPMLEEVANALKTNRGWLSLVDRARTEPDRIDRYLNARERIDALTAQDVQAMAQRYLDPGAAVEILVLPEETVP